MAYASDAATGTNYLEALNGFTDFDLGSEGLTIGGHFRSSTAGGGTIAPFIAVGRGQGATRCLSVGYRPHPSNAANRQVRMYVQDAGTSDQTEDGGGTGGVDYVLGEWWFVALVIADATTRTVYWQAPGDATIQSMSGDGVTSIDPTLMDSFFLGSHAGLGGTATLNADVDCFQCGIARSALGTGVLQDWADGVEVSDLTGMTHAYPLLTDFNDAVGSVNLTETGTVTNVTDPFTPTAGGGGGVSTAAMRRRGNY